MALAQERLYTIADVEALPDSERAELIDGDLYMLATPTRTHQRIVTRLSQKIGNYIDENGGSCEAYVAPFAVYINGADDVHNYVEPDISVICDTSKLDAKGCNGAPDWVIEIVSPSSKRMDYIVKADLYRRTGVREYWVVNPERRAVMVFDFAGDNTDIYAFTDAVPVGIYPGFEIVIADII